MREWWRISCYVTEIYAQTVLFVRFIFLLNVVAAQSQTILTADQLQNGLAVELDKVGWKYVPGADPRFADSQFDVRAWETLNGAAITLDRIPQSGWNGMPVPIAFGHCTKTGWRAVKFGDISLGCIGNIR